MDENVDYINVDDEDEQPREGMVEVESHTLDDYPGGPHDVYILTHYHLHVAYHTSDGVIKILQL